MTIRPAQAQDVQAVLPLVASIAAYHEQRDPQRYCYQPNVTESYRNWLTQRADDPTSVFLVAQHESAQQPGGIVGFLIATVEKELSIYRVGKIGFIHDVWVEPDYRHEGIGRQMVMLAVERFTTIGVSQIRLDVLADNQPAQHLFNACGFRSSTITMLCEIK
ncbi:MAG: GNAT family N-acetyltransferase [Phycisphaerales bacterium]|nr:GNAT family N-acetyltransferase [Phycisphaerales bacterium]